MGWGGRGGARAGLCLPLTRRGLRGFREARRDFWRGAESLEAALAHNAEVPRRRAQEAEEAGAALKVARAGYRGRALDYALQVPAPSCPGVAGPQSPRGWGVPGVQWELAGSETDPRSLGA